jgi:hypothetical protein
MSREAHVRFCERAVVKFRRATRLIVLGEAHLRRILGEYAAYYSANTPRTIMSPERTDRWAKMRRSRAQCSGSEAFVPMRSSADYITITSESRFSVHTANPRFSILATSMISSFRRFSGASHARRVRQVCVNAKAPQGRLVRSPRRARAYRSLPRFHRSPAHRRQSEGLPASR